ncbi:MAG: hypothetical protein GY941_22600 [Planctomycetes bacterium]|nr:hypothetical protein [Planctomycetota bacterium]
MGFQHDDRVEVIDNKRWFRTNRLVGLFGEVVDSFPPYSTGTFVAGGGYMVLLDDYKKPKFFLDSELGVPGEKPKILEFSEIHL